MKKKVAAFLRDETGVSAIEYGLIAALVVIGLTVALTPLGTNLAAKFTTIANSLK